MREINWTSNGGYKCGYTTTKSGCKAFISQVQRTTGAKPLFSLFIEGDKRNVATRATLEKVNQILENR